MLIAVLVAAIAFAVAPCVKLGLAMFCSLSVVVELRLGRLSQSLSQSVSHSVSPWGV